MTDYPEPAAFSIADAANHTGLSRATLYRLMADGQLDTLKIGTRRLVRRDALNKLLDQHENKEAPDA